MSRLNDATAREWDKAANIIPKKDNTEPDVRSYNIGESDYSQHSIQPWDIWEEYKLNPWDADIVKRVLREKGNRAKDYEKIIHVCRERLRQING